jgi:hypothetical protein
MLLDPAFVSGTVHAYPLAEVCSTDVMEVRMTYITGGSKKELILNSAYLPYDSD